MKVQEEIIQASSGVSGERLDSYQHMQEKGSIVEKTSDLHFSFFELASAFFSL